LAIVVPVSEKVNFDSVILIGECRVKKKVCQVVKRTGISGPAEI